MTNCILGKGEDNAQQVCVLHIGAPKTGSTALQNFLTINQEQLKSQGLLYPHATLRAMGHHDLAFLTGNGYPVWAIGQELGLDELLTELQKELSRWEKDIVLSSENFYLLSNPVDVKNALSEIGVYGNYIIKILVYLRRQDEAHLSWYNQIVKAQGFTGTLDESINCHNDLWDYKKQLHRWADEFGGSNIVVRPYQVNNLINGDICNDFLNLISISSHGLKWPSPDKRNTRINKDIVEFQRMVNRLPLSYQDKRQFHKQLIELTTAASSMELFSDDSLMDRSQRKKILSDYTESNKYIAIKYLNNKKLFDIKLPDEEQNKEGEGLNVEKLGYILGWLIARKSENN